MKHSAIIVIIILLTSGLKERVFGQLPGLNPYRFGSMRTLQKLYASKDPDKVRQSIEQFLQRAKDKSNYKQYILFQVLLGDFYERSGDYLLAEKSFMDAYTEAKNHLPRKNENFRLAFFNVFQKTIFDPIDHLAYFYLKIGSLRTAEKLFTESKELRNNYFPQRSIHRVHPIVGMGSWYFRKGDFEKTYELFNQATRLINRATTTGYDFDNLNRLFLSDLAEICLALGKKEEALGYINQLAIASSGARKFPSKVSARLEVARIFELKARYFLLKGDYNKAREYLDKADWFNPTKVAVSDVKFKLIKTRALLEWYQGNMEKATAAFENLVREYRKHIAYNFSTMSEYEKEQFYYSLKKDFDLYNAYVLDQGNGTPGLNEEMYNNVLNTKALLLNETNRQKNKIILQGDPAMIAKLHEWEDTKARLSAQYYEKGGPTKVDSLENRIDALEKELNSVSGLFEQKDELTWQQVRSTLGPKEAAAEIVRVKVARKGSLNFLTDSVVYAVLLVTPKAETPELFVIPNGNQLEKYFLPYYRNAIRSRIDDRLTYDQFWLPIKKKLSSFQRLYLSPDGVYNQINLNTLQNTVTNQFLIDEIQLVYLTNTSDLLHKQNEAVASSAVLVGRPSYDFEDTEKSTISNPETYGQRNVISEEMQEFKEQEFADLPGTENEVSMIEPILEKRNLKVVTYKGEQALEENVKAVQHPAILHIATHGFFVDDAASTVSPMIRSGIVLAGVKNDLQKPGSDDGILTAYEATNLDLEGTDLVVLSACQTGLGEVRNGEGVYGLQRAIIVAGAQNLLMSLWKVDDEATAALMASFYGTWTGQNNTGEFREAQIKLRQKYPQPFYWGAFVMLGK